MAESLSDDDKTDSIESSSFQDNYEDFNKEFMKKLLYNQQNVNWCDFDIMKDGQLSFWECEFLNESENWTKSTCSCPACLKIINDLINQSQNEDTSRIGQLIHQVAKILHIIPQHSISEDFIRNIFNRFGNLIDVRSINSQLCYIMFSDERSADIAMKTMNGQGNSINSYTCC
ncbi:unnamed protein product [Rotaria sordida]|uniref:RRM domain-containing protein n=2 Tax=Rotaria sordida TaxID=392033 RepID=A0A814E280_9BILA|nr:unnamed protein product [Rotaria sordida]